MIETGDLLFEKAGERELSQAIAGSTAGKEDFPYVHAGLLEREKDGLFLLHASLKKGCLRERLESFLEESHGDLDVYRVTKDHPFSKEEVLHRAEAMIGAPYNASFYPEGKGWYCATFIAAAFKDDSIFHMEPMAFGPKGLVLPFWKDYYEKLSLAVPEGLAGLSPNGMIRQGALRRTGTLRDALSSEKEGHAIYGLLTDEEGRCSHYHTERDVAALRCDTCGRYYACYQCHDLLEDHPFQPVSADDTAPVLCGSCFHTMTQEEYEKGHCPFCGHHFNPGCKKHHHIYFCH